MVELSTFGSAEVIVIGRFTHSGTVICQDICSLDLYTLKWNSKYQGLVDGPILTINTVQQSIILSGNFTKSSLISFTPTLASSLMWYNISSFISQVASASSSFYTLSTGRLSQWTLNSANPIAPGDIDSPIVDISSVSIQSNSLMVAARSNLLLFEPSINEMTPIASFNGPISRVINPDYSATMDSLSNGSSSSLPIWGICILVIAAVLLIVLGVFLYFKRKESSGFKLITKSTRSNDPVVVMVEKEEEGFKSTRFSADSFVVQARATLYRNRAYSSSNNAALRPESGQASRHHSTCTAGTISTTLSIPTHSKQASQSSSLTSQDCKEHSRVSFASMYSNLRLDNFSKSLFLFHKRHQKSESSTVDPSDVQDDLSAEVKRVVVATHDYIGTDPSELSFRKGDFIEILDETDHFWRYHLIESTNWLVVTAG